MCQNPPVMRPITKTSGPQYFPLVKFLMALPCHSGNSKVRRERIPSSFIQLFSCSIVQIFKCFHAPCSSVLTTRGKTKVFTLIEFLIVIAMIAILAAMLLPALNQVRSKARSISCLNQNRQISQSMMGYQMDFNDYFIFWGTSTSDSWAWNLHKYDYLKNSRLYLCPDLPPDFAYRRNLNRSTAPLTGS